MPVVAILGYERFGDADHVPRNFQSSEQSVCPCTLLAKTGPFSLLAFSPPLIPSSRSFILPRKERHRHFFPWPRPLCFAKPACFPSRARSEIDYLLVFSMIPVCFTFHWKRSTREYSKWKMFEGLLARESIRTVENFWNTCMENVI